MKASQGKTGRIFVIRLEDGDRMPESLEKFAQDNNIKRGMCILIGGVKDGSTLVLGPRDGNARPVDPMQLSLEGVHEIAGIGTLVPDKSGKPSLHMHASAGREDKSKTGCIRPGIEIWKLGEIILLEIVDNKACRVLDPETGFSVLEP